MDDPNKYPAYANLPIPSYEEATSSRPTSSQTHRGPGEISDDAERQGLLGQHEGYRPPTVESPRSSEDSDLRLPEVTGDEDRRQIEELDYLDPSAEPSQRGVYHRARLRSQFSKTWTNLSATFSSLRLPSFRSFYTPVSSSDDTTAETPTEPQPQRSFMSRFYVPQAYRVSAPNIARVAALFTICLMVYVLFAFDMFPGGRRHIGSHFDPESVRQFVQENINAQMIEGHLQHITSFDHVAGTEGDFYLAKWMQERWVEEGGFDEVSLQKYYVYLNYPENDGRTVNLLKPSGEIQWTAKLEEEQVDTSKQQTWAWHGHSMNGDATGHLIFANDGAREDFQWLRDNGVKTEGAIALVRSYGLSSDPDLPLGVKVKAAEDAGCVGVLIFSDPTEDGAAQGNLWPDGRWRPKDSVQRGSVSYGNWIVGDPLTPGWASRKKHDHTKIESNFGLPKIPSLPLSWRNADHLIRALKGHGLKVPKKWTGGIYGTGEWYSGTADGNGAPKVELRNYNDFNKDQEIWNLHGLIQGIESPEKRVIIGSHRDSWCFGSVDPGSGSAIMMEVASIFLALRKIGWRPLRTIEFASWDAGAYNSIGSTEFVEDNMGYLRDHGIAYLNVDAGIYGQEFRANGSPLLKKALMHVLNRVSDPTSNNTLRQLWDKDGNTLSGIAGGGDYVAFQTMAGTASLDFGFEGKPHSYPRHSCYETFEWMRKFGDNRFQYHRTLAAIWALMILEIADRPLIPFNLDSYAESIQGFVDQLQRDAQDIYSQLNDGVSVKGAKQLTKLTGVFDLTPLRYAAANLTHDVHAFHRFEDIWTSNVLGAGGLEAGSFAIQRLGYNDKIAHFESDLLDLPYKHGDTGVHGLPGREQFKHVLFAPERWGGGVSVFPAIRDAMEDGEWEVAQRMVVRTAKILERAGRRLVE